MSEEVLELSIAETNKLRAELGLAPLRLNPDQQPKQEHVDSGVGEQDRNNSSNNQKEILEMSVEDTNALRAKLGLKPLKVDGDSKIVHKPAENDREKNEVADRIAKSKLERQVQEGYQTFGSSTLGGDDEEAFSWAERMRQQRQKEAGKPSNDAPESAVRGAKSKSKKKKAKATKDGNYTENDLAGLHVSHALGDLEAGSATVLTLADAPLLEMSSESNKVVGLNDGDVALENVNLSEQQKQQDGLRKKRLLEMGMGRAGGYAGYDDEEFEELGGTLGPARKERSNPLLMGDDDDLDGDSTGTRKKGGFRIGVSPNEGDTAMTDLEKIQRGKAISLAPAQADMTGNDYMTLEEEEAERASKKKKKDAKFKKKKKKKDKKKRRRTTIDSDDEEEEAGSGAATNSSILEKLEQTGAPEASVGLRKRRRSDSEDGDGPDPTSSSGVTPSKNTEEIDHSYKRSRYDEIMNKGNERTRLAFENKPKEKPQIDESLDEELDDSFLNAAVAKARRLNRLREMGTKKEAKGADAIAAAVQSTKVKQEEQPDANPVSSGTISFAIDDTREFTRALRARELQKEREAEKAAKKEKANVLANVAKFKNEEAAAAAASNESDSNKIQVETANPEQDAMEEEELDIQELAKQVKTDDLGIEEGTARGAGVGRGLSSFVSMLQHTGEIKAKRAGGEELRGRARDERNYENYEPVDLSKVVKIGNNATDKDKELANREVKLEYRDKHGRLLTPKAAFRDLCYQFHGHGASKKKEEKLLKQIALEQAEARLSSRQVAAARDGTAGGTLGALKATQKATGKAFIVHKT